jgi:hypothetical protein
VKIPKIPKDHVTDFESDSKFLRTDSRIPEKTRYKHINQIKKNLVYDSQGWIVHMYIYIFTYIVSKVKLSL